METLRFLLLCGLAACAYAACGCTPKSAAFDDGTPDLPVPDPETGLVEGDMRLTANNYLELLGARNTVSNLWPGGLLHYKVSSGSASQVASALSKLQSATGNCVKFAVRSSQAAYVDVFSGSGCWSYVGRTGSRQQLSLGSGCYHEYIIQHEFLHALGFYHEHSRQDRDNYLTIYWNNIDSNQCNAFYKKGRLISGFPGYDYKSVMHYEGWGFACKSGVTTMATKSGGSVGGRSLTSTDIRKIKMLYNC